MHQFDSTRRKKGTSGKVKNHHKNHAHHEHSHEEEAKAFGEPIPGTERKTVKLVTQILDANNRIADENRRVLQSNRVYAVNIISSPGSGKTTLLEATLQRLIPEFRIAVVEGDIATTNDAQRIAAFGVPVVQILTQEFGGACHLEAASARQALEQIDLHSIDLLFIENVGNLVCPAEFDLGEDSKVVLCSVTEGEDKPAKYPLVFQVASLALVNKVDLLPYLKFDLKSLYATIKQVNRRLPTIELSAQTGQGLDAWLSWIRDNVARKQSQSHGR